MRYFVGFLIAIGLLILVIILIVTSGGKKSQVPSTSKTLWSYSTTDAAVSMLFDTPINANVSHRQVLITVDRNNATYDELSGYDGHVIETKSYPNTENAYNVFLHALARVGFTQGNTDKALQDERGACPLGDRYVFLLTQGANQLQRFWATTCGGTKTYLGNLSNTITLFQNQIPDYATLSASVQ